MRQRRKAPGPKNHERLLVGLVREAARELGVRTTVLGDGWILRLERGGVVRHVHGYHFDLNTAATHQVCCDKAATSAVLSAAGVANVAHELVLHPEMARFVRMESSWKLMLAAFERWGRDVVIKDNTGTGGRGVLRCRSVIELERGAMGLFQRCDALAVCPYVGITSERRYVLLDGECLLAYEKVRASVVGDGERSLLGLLSASGTQVGAVLENLTESERLDLARVPRRGEVCIPNWRHNLGQGASAKIIDQPQAQDLSVARAAAGALGLRFGSVDVVRVGKSGAKVLEVNAGVMMEFLARTVVGGEALARRVYGQAIGKMFGF
jgi:glutathione synthase/RimK-type ligase-like ATP-grasp enzyme